MKNFNTKPLKGLWYTYPKDKDIQVLVRPFSLFSMNTMPSEDAKEVNIKDFYNNFEYVVLDWKGMNIDGKPAKCRPEDKKFIYENFQELVGFVIESSMKARESIISEKAIKN